MKEEKYTSLICEKFCSYYKKGKDTEVCGGYYYLKRFLTPSELRELLEFFHLEDVNFTTEDIDFICEKCNFRVDGCDFIISKSSIPCGGYLIINRLLQYLNS